MTAAGALAVALAAQVLSAPAPVSQGGVVRSTAAVAAQPDIPALKRRIQTDQEDVLRARDVFKRAKKRKDAAAQGKADAAWQQAKDRLKADRALLRQAIEAREAGRAEKPQTRGDQRKPD